MFRSEHAHDVTVPARTGVQRERVFTPRWDDGRDAHSGRNPVTDVLGSVSKTLLSLAVLALVVTGCIFAFQTVDLADPTNRASAKTAQAPSTAIAATGQDQATEIAALRAEVALVTEQSLELRAELALLTGQGGVLPQMINRLQEQRRVNAAHSNALRQLYSTKGLIGASLPSLEEPATAAGDVGSRPVQVTPVANAQDEAPKRVVLIPQGSHGSAGEPKAGAGDGE
ncbi:MAG: hypothetical protein P1U83_11260 [Roseovarius sp.]|nr:hypothetical protein [Roseovarius sp.]